MKAPDKIYYYKTCINPSGYEQGQAYELNPDPLPCVEYIRKDALLEWAKNEQKESTTVLADDWWQEVINKINSL